MSTGIEPLNDAALLDMGVELVLAMMASASTDHIRPTDWWERARTALEISAEASDSKGEMVTRFASRNKAHTLAKRTVERLSSLSSLDDPAVFTAFRRFVSRQSTYVVAFAQERRGNERAEAESDKAAKAPVEARLASALDEVRSLKADRDMWKNQARSLSEDVRVLKAKVEAGNGTN